MPLNNTCQDLYKDFGLLYFPRNHSSRQERPWSTPNKQPTFDQTVFKTLFGQKYVSVTVDEAHEFRNSGVKHIAALELLKLTVVKLIATATPLLTSNTVCFLSYVCGIQFKLVIGYSCDGTACGVASLLH